MAEAGQGGEKVVPEKEMHGFIVRCLLCVGAPDHHASALADLLTAADLRGHYSHGLNRLGKLFKVSQKIKLCTILLSRPRLCPFMPWSGTSC